MPVRAVIFDFYNTLAEVAPGATLAELLAEAGYPLTPEARERWWDGGIDGTEHDEHSRSRDHYVAWQQLRTRAMLEECGVPECEFEALIERMDGHFQSRPIRAYEEVHDVIEQLRARGVRLAVCSNWDWDLGEAMERAALDGCFDIVVSSAWVGARKPHPRIYRRTIEALGVDAADALFIGDTWTCDVDGPRAAGLRAVYLRRSHLGPDVTAPSDVDRHEDVVRASDLRVLSDIERLAAG